MCTASAQDSWLISEFTDMLRDTQTMTSTYAYTPLDLSKDSIRLLRLCKGDARTEIRCELVESFLSESEGLPYEALSYTWGGELTSDSPRILLNGVDFPITKNLFEALCSLRLGIHDRLMWVDALCINQDDHREKGHQVGQMRFVYQNAETVLVWLGPSSSAIDDLMASSPHPFIDMMTEWGKHSNQQQQRLSNMMTLWSASTRFQFKGSGKTAYEGHMLTFGELLERPWFRRVWILQEVANARSAVIICGSKSVSSRVFSAMPYLIGLKELNPHTKAVMDVMPGPLRKQSWWNIDRRLITLLIKFHRSQATQQHDRIYALFGIASDAPDLPITYGCPFQHVFAQILSLLTFGDVSQSHLFGHKSPFRFEELFSGVTNAHELKFRVFELALQHSEEVLAKRLIGASDLYTDDYDAVSHYEWREPYYESVFTLYAGVDEHTYTSLAAIFQSTLRRHHYMVCIDICEIFGFVPDEYELKWALPSIPTSVFLGVVKQILAADSARLTSILALVLEAGHLQLLHVLLEHHSLVGYMILDDNRLKMSFPNPCNGILKFLLEGREAAGAIGFSATDIMWAVVLGAEHVSMLNALIDCGADIHAARHEYGTPLQRAVHSKHAKVAQILAKQGADLSLRDDKRDTLLHYAEQMDFGRKDDDMQRTICTLLLYGNEELAEDKEGRTPWQRNIRNRRGTKRRNKDEMFELFSLVKEEDMHLYLRLIQDREGGDTEHHPETTANSKRKRELDDSQGSAHRNVRMRPKEEDLARTRKGGLL
ncbi:hypothetical protein PG988_006144 [Apiospora saccharicola]